MAKKPASFSPSAYSTIFKVREARLFDIGALLMRVYSYMVTIGTISMLTLAGCSYFSAGIVASTAALSTFLISPRVSRRIDEKGQFAIVPKAVAIALAGLSLMLLVVALDGPLFICLAAAVLLGFAPSSPSLARARWTHLIKSGRLGKDAPPITTVFSYEGILDDVAFMVGPSCSIALAASVHPIAGMFLGGLCMLAGSLILVSSRDTEPIPSQPATAKRVGRSMFMESSVVRALFFIMLFLGAFYGVMDAATVAFAEEAGDPGLASIVLVLISIASVVSGAVFGMLKLPISLPTQLALVSCLVGITYGLLAIIDSTASMIAILVFSSMFYAPLIITSNAACEACVPIERLTEAMTWMHAGTTCGLMFGPTLAGMVIDQFGALVGFDFCAALACGVPIVAIVSLPAVKKRFSDA